MDVLIRVDQAIPPAGTVLRLDRQQHSATETGVRFVGWLGLLRVLGEILGDERGAER